MPSLFNMCALALLGGAIATEHHVHKREPGVVEVTVQQTVYVTAFGDDEPTSVASANLVAAATGASNNVGAEKNNNAPLAVESSTAPKETSSAAPPASSPAPPASSAPAPSSTGAETSSSTSPSEPESGSGDAGALGITYSPYTTGACKSASQVKSELQQLSGFNVIRLYSTDCSQVENVAAALGDHQKMFLGIFDVSDVAGEAKKIAAALKNDFSRVHTISVGNELVNGGAATVDQVKQYVDTARTTLRSLGYQGPVNTVDTFIATINNPGLCDVGDYVSVNAHAFFDGGVSAEQAGDWLLGNIQRVSAACGGKKTIITESGWPSQGETNGKAVCGASEQKAAVASIKKSCGDDTFLFTAFNDYWKSPGAFAAEQYWGIYSS